MIESYCRAVAAALGLTIRFQWKEGGIECEMLRENSRTAGIHTVAHLRTATTGGVQWPEPNAIVGRDFTA